MSKRILITGGAGFIGVNAAERFVKNGWDTVVFDNFSRKGTDLNRAYLQSLGAKSLTIVQGDIRNAQDLQGVFQQHFDVVLHLAAQVAVTTSVTDPREDFEINALGTFNVLEAIRATGERPLVLFASTNKVYGGLEDVAVTEEDRRYRFADITGVPETQQLDFHSPYGCSKGAADQYVRDYTRIYGIPSVVFRQSCIYGPHQMGVEDQGWVAWFLIAARYGRPVTVYGNGKQVRDLLYVDDLIDLYERAIERQDKAAGHVYNVGGGSENTLSLLEFLSFMQGDLGLDIRYSFGDTRPGDQPIFVSDNGAVTRDLGWKPAMGVPGGIRALDAWLQTEPALRSLYGA